MDGKPQRMRFYTTRFMEEANPRDAENAAIDLLRVEGKLKPFNDRDDSPRVFVTEVEEVDEADVPSIVHGFAFFPDEE